MKNHDRKLQELGDRLVQREVYYCASSLMYGIAQIMFDCRGFSEQFGEPDELMDLYRQDDWETPGDWFVMEDADFDDLEKITNEYGDWDELLNDLKIRPEVYPATHWVCDDCLNPIVNGDLSGIPEDKQDLFESYLEEFEGGDPTGESEEFANYRCDCCGTTLAGGRHAFSDGSVASDDIEDRLKLAARDGEGIEKELRRAVSDLVGAQSGGWEWVGREFDIDPEQSEVYEHWIVSNWLAERLKEEGHVVGDFAGLTLWGRQTTGQSISMDGVIQRIAGNLWSEELAEVKEDEE